MYSTEIKVYIKSIRSEALWGSRESGGSLLELCVPFQRRPDPSMLGDGGPPRWRIWAKVDYFFTFPDQRQSTAQLEGLPELDLCIVHSFIPRSCVQAWTNKCNICSKPTCSLWSYICSAWFLLQIVALIGVSYSFCCGERYISWHAWTSCGKIDSLCTLSHAPRVKGMKKSLHACVL